MQALRAHPSAARRATRTARPATTRYWSPPAAAGARCGGARERSGAQPKGSTASQHRTSCSMLADSFLSTPASLPVALAGGGNARESASGHRRTHKAHLDRRHQSVWLTGATRGADASAERRRGNAASAGAAWTATAPGGVAPRPSEANTKRGKLSVARPAAAGAQKGDALPRTRRVRHVRPGAHKTRRSSCRARCCRRGHTPPARCSGCGARKQPQRLCRYGSTAACTHGARRAPLGAKQRSGRAVRARGTLRVECCAGQQCACRAHLFSDSMSRYFMRPAFAPSACGGARGGGPGEVHSRARRGVQVYAAARVHVRAREAPRRQDAGGTRCRSVGSVRTMVVRGTPRGSLLTFSSRPLRPRPRCLSPPSCRFPRCEPAQLRKHHGSSAAAAAFGACLLAAARSLCACAARRRRAPAQHLRAPPRARAPAAGRGAPGVACAGVGRRGRLRAAQVRGAAGARRWAGRAGHGAHAGRGRCLRREARAAQVCLGGS